VNIELDSEVRAAVYQHFATHGQSPSVHIVSALLGCSEDDVRAAFARLREKRVLLLEPDGETIRMAPPFSGVPTQHTVTTASQTYFANCAWDALGIPAALHQDAIVRSSCGESGAPLRLAVSQEGPEPSSWVFHCQVPAAKWWENLIFT
jgi:Alkylmercury lyase